MPQFVNQSQWAHEARQLNLARLMLRNRRAKKKVMVLDDTSLPKQGRSSVSVVHQYCGAAGKVGARAVEDRARLLATEERARAGSPRRAVVARLAPPDALFYDVLLFADGEEGQKKYVEVAAGEALAESDSKLDTPSVVSKLSPRAAGRAVRLIRNYLT